MSENSPKISSNQLHLRVHPLRSQLHEELHNRPSPIVQAPCYVSHVSCLMDDEQRQQQYDILVDLAQRFSVNPPIKGASCFYQDFGGFSLRWESHLEFATYTFIRNIDSQTANQALQDDSVFQENALSFIPLDWVQALPGEFLSAVHLSILEGDSEITTSSLKNSFEGARLFGSHVAGDNAEVYASFRIHSDGFSRVLIQNRNLNDYQIGRLMQRVLDIESYRLLSLLGLPAARELAPKIRVMEQQLVDINHLIAQRQDQENDSAALGELTVLASKIEKKLSDTSYRIGATNAYFDIVNARLGELREKEILGLQTISEFLNRRLSPGIKTCNALQLRMARLSSRVTQTSSLLRTRIEMTIESQNQALLASMNDRSGMQLRLQQAVEGVSVAAIAYYLLGLLTFIYEALIELGINLSLKVALGISVPVVLLITWLAVHRVIRSISKDGK